MPEEYRKYIKLSHKMRDSTARPFVARMRVPSAIGQKQGVGRGGYEQRLGSHQTPEDAAWAVNTFVRTQIHPVQPDYPLLPVPERPSPWTDAPTHTPIPGDPMEDEPFPDEPYW